MTRRLLVGCFLALLPVCADARSFPFRLLKTLAGGTQRQVVPDQANEPERVEEPVTFAPIAPPQDDQHLYKAFVERQTKWLEKQFLLDFPKRNAGAPWLADAVEVLRGAAFNLANGSENAIAKPDYKAPESLVAKAKNVRAAGCDDPLFNFVTAYLDTANHGPHRDRIALAESHWETLLAGGDSPHLKMFVAGWIRFHGAESPPTRNKERVARMEAVLPKLVENALAAIADEEDALGFYQLQSRNTPKGKEPDELQLQSYLWPHHDEIRPFLDKPNVPSWLRDAIIGDRAVWAAWQARGDGWGGEVNKDGWKGFREQLEIAARHLTAAWRAKPELPFAAQKMITVTMGQSGGDEMLRVWFDRSTAACFDYMPAYSSLTWAYRPRWGGSHELMLAMGKAAFETKRFDTRVPGVYNWILEDISDDLTDRTGLMKRRELWVPCHAITSGWLDHAKTETDRTYALSWGIFHAVVGHDYAKAAEFRRQLKQPILPIADTVLYKTYGFWHFEWRGILSLQKDSEVAAAFDQAEENFRNHRLEAAREGFLKLGHMPSIESEGEAKDLVAQRLAAIEVETRLNTGAWVKLSDSEHRLLWRNQDPYLFEPRPDGVLIEKSHPSPSTYLTARIGLDFELRAKLANPPELERPQFGCYLAYRPGFADYATVICGQTNADRGANKGAALVRTLYPTTPRNPPVPAELKLDSEVRVRSEKGKVTFWVDGVEVFSRRLQDALEDIPRREERNKPEYLIGLGSPYFPKGESRLKEIEFRRILSE
ncbi:MAG TPA: hypothetical protein VIM57_07075 [Luteolibacter sp.]